MSIEYLRVRPSHSVRPWVIALGLLYIVGGGLPGLMLLAVIPFALMSGEALFGGTAEAVVGAIGLGLAAVFSGLSVYAGIGLARGRYFALPWCTALSNLLVYLGVGLITLVAVQLVTDRDVIFGSLSIENYLLYGFVLLFGVLGLAVSLFLNSARVHDHISQTDAIAGPVRSGAFLTLALLALFGPPSEYVLRLSDDYAPNPLGWSLLALAVLGHLVVVVLSLLERRAVLWVAWSVVLLHIVLCFVTERSSEPFLSDPWLKVQSMGVASAAILAVALVIFGKFFRRRSDAGSAAQSDVVIAPVVSANSPYPVRVLPVNPPPLPDSAAQDPP